MEWSDFNANDVTEVTEWELSLCWGPQESRYQRRSSICRWGETGCEEMEWTRTLTYSVYIIDTDPGAGNVSCIERDTAVGVV